MTSFPQKIPAIFLDRDGTLNSDPGYPSSIADVELLPGAVEAVKIFNRLPAPVLVITNQSGVARGMFSERAVQQMNRDFMAVFERSDAPLSGIYYCPHHPKGSVPTYRRVCDCRKPERALFDRAAAEHQIELSTSIMIGDKFSDVIAGKRLGMKSFLVLTGEGKIQLAQYREEAEYQPDGVFDDLVSVARWIDERWKPGIGLIVEKPQ